MNCLRCLVKGTPVSRDFTFFVCHQGGQATFVKVYEMVTHFDRDPFMCYFVSGLCVSSVL